MEKSNIALFLQFWALYDEVKTIYLVPCPANGKHTMNIKSFYLHYVGSTNDNFSNLLQ
jgi:hypothetical protein